MRRFGQSIRRIVKEVEEKTVGKFFIIGYGTYAIQMGFGRECDLPSVFHLNNKIIK